MADPALRKALKKPGVIVAPGVVFDVLADALLHALRTRCPVYTTLARATGIEVSLA